MRPRVPPTFRLMLTIRCLFQVCTSNEVLPTDVFFVWPFMYTCFIIMGCLRKKKPNGQTGALGGESQFYEKLKVIGDFRAEAASQSPSYHEELA